MRVASFAAVYVAVFSLFLSCGSHDVERATAPISLSAQVFITDSTLTDSSLQSCEESDYPGWIYPSTMSVDWRGKVYIPDQVNHQVIRYDTNGRRDATIEVDSGLIREIECSGDTAIWVKFECDEVVYLYSSTGKQLQSIELPRPASVFSTWRFSCNGQLSVSLYESKDHLPIAVRYDASGEVASAVSVEYGAGNGSSFWPEIWALSGGKWNGDSVTTWAKIWRQYGFRIAEMEDEVGIPDTCLRFTGVIGVDSESRLFMSGSRAAPEDGWSDYLVCYDPLQETLSSCQFSAIQHKQSGITVLGEKNTIYSLVWDDRPGHWIVVRSKIL